MPAKKDAADDTTDVDAEAIAAAKVKLETEAAAKKEADKAADIKKKAAGQLEDEAKIKAQAEAAEAERAARLTPHAVRLDALVRDGKITPAERKAAEAALLDGRGTEHLLDVLTQRPAGKSEQTGPQVGEAAGGLVASAERIAQQHKEGRF